MNNKKNSTYAAAALMTTGNAKISKIRYCVIFGHKYKHRDKGSVATCTTYSKYDKWRYCYRCRRDIKC